MLSALIISADDGIRQTVTRAGDGLAIAMAGCRGADNARAMLGRAHFDMVLCDAALHDGSADDLLAAAFRKCPGAERVLIVHGLPAAGCGVIARESRADGILTVHLDECRLRSILSALIDRVQPARSAGDDMHLLRAERDNLRHWTAHLEGVVHDRTNDMTQAYDETLSALVKALDAREHATAGHSRRVALLALYLAMHFGVEHEALESIYRGAMLHDLGKIGIADAILLKPGSLDVWERQAIERHAEVGEGLIEGVGYLESARMIVRSHHEKFDGTGYPDGLRGTEIPLGARLFAIVDVYDALRSERPYKSAMTHEEACADIRAAIGTHFDPHVATCFLSIDYADLQQIFACADDVNTFTKAIALCTRFLHSREGSLRVA